MSSCICGDWGYGFFDCPIHKPADHRGSENDERTNTMGGNAYNPVETPSTEASAPEEAAPVEGAVLDPIDVAEGDAEEKE